MRLGGHYPGPVLAGGKQHDRRSHGAHEQREQVFAAGTRGRAAGTQRLGGRLRSAHSATVHSATVHSTTVTGSGSASKQVRSPVWQAPPVWSTFTSTVSPSQSSATALTCCTWPDVPPFTQYS